MLSWWSVQTSIKHTHILWNWQALYYWQVHQIQCGGTYLFSHYFPPTGKALAKMPFWENKCTKGTSAFRQCWTERDTLQQVWTNLSLEAAFYMQNLVHIKVYLNWTLMLFLSWRGLLRLGRILQSHSGADKNYQSQVIWARWSLLWELRHSSITLKKKSTLIRPPAGSEVSMLCLMGSGQHFIGWYWALSCKISQRTEL